MKKTILTPDQQTVNHGSVLRLDDIDMKSVSSLLSHYGLSLAMVPADSEIPGSFWGDERLA